MCCCMAFLASTFGKSWCTLQVVTYAILLVLLNALAYNGKITPFLVLYKSQLEMGRRY